MTHADRKKKIESYGKAHALLVKTLKKFPRKMWKYKPAPDRWSIHEIIVHITDSEANSYVRCRRFISEPGQAVMAYDQDTWTRALRYHEQSTADALALFRLLRLSSYNLIRSLPASVWSNTVAHPELGAINFDRWLDIYERHIPGHIEQMKKNLVAWREVQQAQ
jgi:hypothetical protein